MPKTSDPPRTYWVDVTAYDHVSTFPVTASSEQEAVQKAMLARAVGIWSLWRRWWRA